MCMSEHTRHADRVDKMCPRCVPREVNEPMRRRRLSAGEISAMRRFFDAGHPIKDLSRKYHVHREVASRICNRKTYVDVRDDLGTILPPTPVPETDLMEVAARRLSGARSR